METLRKLVRVEPGEVTALFISCAYFYLVLCAYYIFRPIRNEMVIANGVQNVQWLLLLTLAALLCVAPIFGWLTSRFRTRQFLAYCTLFFASHLVLFFLLFNVEQRPAWVNRSFFVWVNVFNMFIVSLFWSFMNDIYTRRQSKRLFAFIAAGGTAGAVSGPIITSSLVTLTGLAPLLLISAGVLSCSVVAMTWLNRWNNPALAAGDTELNAAQLERRQALKGGALDGITLIMKSPYLLGICLFIALYAMSITFVEIQQAEIVQATLHDPVERTALFSKIDLSVNVLAFLFQLFVTSHLVKRLGYRFTLMLIPMGITLGFALMAVTPLLAVMIGVEIFRRAGDYSIMKPAREMLFTVLSREEKYKAKNFIDTTILRAGNAVSAVSYAGIKSFGAFGVGMAGISVALGLAWTATAFWLGSQFERKRPNTEQVEGRT